jgi:uncharacterized protein YraI
MHAGRAKAILAQVTIVSVHQEIEQDNLHGTSRSATAKEDLKVMFAKRLMILVCGLLLALLPGLSGQAQSVPDARVAVGLLSMRSGPARTASLVATLPRGTALTLDGRNRAATWVHGTADDGAVGWVARPYLAIRRTLSIARLPILDASAPTSGGNPGGQSASSQTSPTQAPLAPPVVSGKVSGRFELGGQVQDLNGNTIAAMQRAGMKWVKRQAQNGDGGAVGLINQAHGAGFKILLSVVGDRNAVVEDGYQSGYAAYVGSLAAQGADAIEVWNEMNIDREWRTGSINPALYVSLLARSYNAIKRANPNTIVISGALAPTGAEGAFGTSRVWNDDRYYAGMAAAGAGSYLDCVGVHYNEGIVSPNANSGDPRGSYPTRFFSSMLNRAIGPFGGKSACITELGYLTPEGYGTLPGGFAWAQNTTVAQQAAWLAQAAVKASASGRVRLMIIFNVDFTLFGEDPQAGYAMIRPGGRCPACDTLGAVMR